jgi:hypothetical protein
VIYSVIGMSIFPYLKHRTGINKHANFSSFSLAFVTLIRISTIEGWNELMEDSLRKLRPNDICIDIPDYESFEAHGKQFIGCGNTFAYIFYMTFIVIFGFVLINLFTGVIIEAFYLRARLTSSKVNVQHITEFIRKWREFDENSTGFIACEKGELLVHVLKPPLGLASVVTNRKQMISQMLEDIKIPLYRHQETHQLHYFMYDFLLGLIKYELLLDDRYTE